MSTAILMNRVLDLQAIEENMGLISEPNIQFISPASIAFCKSPFPFSSFSAAFCN